MRTRQNAQTRQFKQLFTYFVTNLLSFYKTPFAKTAFNFKG